MAINTLFPTLVYQASLQRRGAAQFNRRLLRECEQIRHDDTAGRRWSARRFPGGYTSYGSAHRLHQSAPMFTLLERRLRRHLASFVRTLELDLEGRALAMTDCWLNVMPPGVVHSLHLHPLSTISGTYYVRTPRGCPGLKFEDPRADRFMAAPPRKPDARRENQPWVSLAAVAGKLVLFESWLRHEVAPNTAASERISISFNYNWF